MVKVILIALFVSFLVPGIAKDSLQVFTYDQIVQNYIGGRFKTTLMRDDVADAYGDQYSGKVGCTTCQLIGKYKSPNSDAQLYLSANHVEDVSVKSNLVPIGPIIIGRNRKGFKIEMHQNEIVELNINYTILPKDNPSFLLHENEPELIDWVEKGRIKEYGDIFHALFLGCVGMFILFSFSTYFFYRGKDVLFYGLYALMLFIYFGVDYGLHNSLMYGPSGHYMKRLAHPAMFFFYILFLRAWINDRVHFPKLYSLYHYSLLFLIVVFIVFLFSFPPYNRSLFDSLNQYYQLLAGVVAIYLIFLMARLKPPLYTFLISGHLFLTFGSLAAIVLSAYDFQIGFIIPLHWMMIGILCELIIFSAALGYRMQLSNAEKLSIQNALIGEMQKNKEILESRQDELKQIVKKTEAKFIEEERDKIRAEISLNEKMVELDLLRNQMNPHFIFNSLNSIKSFIIKNKPRIAGDYITKFAALMRLILANSKELEITLSKELEAVCLYIELEQIRMGDQFDFKLIIDESIDPDVTFIQPLILQPFIENAIWHGLRYLDKKGSLSINIEQDNEGVRIVIEDNGIGRSASAKKKKLNFIKSKSYGIDITKERLSKKYKGEYSLFITDLLIHEEEPGTRVELILPLLIESGHEQN